jgi:hypothetical protein
MSDETNDIHKKDKKELLREKRELKMLERFMYDRESSLRESTRKIKTQENYYTELIKGNPKIVDLEDSTSSKKSKKRGKKKKEAVVSSAGSSKIKIENIMNDSEEDVEDGPRNSRYYKDESYSQSQAKTKNDNNSVISNSENKISMTFKPSFMLTNFEDNNSHEEMKYDDSVREKVETNFPNEVSKFNEQREKFERSLSSKTFINCDLRFFNFDLITSRVGHFDVIMLDPPWRIKGAQRNDSSFMFSNSKFNLEYNTLSNNEIISLPVEKLSKKGKIVLK